MQMPYAIKAPLKSLATRVCVLGFSLLAGSMAAAETVSLVFEPPEIAREPICIAGLADEQLEAMWAGWAGDLLPDRAPDLIRRDMKRLMELDAIKWFSKIEKVYSLMPTVDSQFGPDKAMLERSALLIAAGRLKELTNQRLVDQLMSSKQGGSPRMLNTLSDYLMQGIGIKQDKEKATAMLVAAGYGGNADALLKIVGLQQAGTIVPGWDVPPDIAVTMAFGALVGKLDPMICDRVSRIAREYMNGEIVTRDIAMAETWFKFAADLGDTSSAWKIAEMHMRSEDLVKSNDTLVTYLTKAADGGLPFAQVTLGRAYELGALVPQDTDRARTLYAASAQFGDRAGVVRNVLFLQAEAKANNAKLPAYRAALAELAKRPDAPGWAFIGLAEVVLEQKGRWAGEIEATALLEKAADLGDADAAKRLTPIRFRHAKTPDEFYAIIDEVIETVHLQGEIDPMNGLKSAFTCRAPNAPQREEANYWRDISAATGTKTVEFSPEELLQLIARPDVQEVARLQSQALYGRPTALAQYMAVLDRTDAPPAQIAFWQHYAQRYEKVSLSRGRLERKFADIGQNIGDPGTYFRMAIAEGDVSAGVELAETLMEANPQAFGPEATAALLPLAAQGVGAALSLLPQTDPARFPDARAVYGAYAQVIEDRGDFDAVLLALPFLDTTAAVEDYKARATTLTDCSFDQVMLMVRAMGAIGDTEAFAKWMNIAEFLSESDSWRMVKMGDTLRQFGDARTLTDQIDFFEVGYKAGSITAIHRLLESFSKPGTPTYNPGRSADLFVDLIGRIDAADVPHTLKRIAAAPPAISADVYSRIDVEALYRTSADDGSAVAMLELGKIIRDRAISADELAEATDWIGKSAELGEVEAMVAYADALAFGIGIDTSREKALVWLGKAAEAGNEEAAAKVRGLTLEVRVSQ